MSTNPNASAKSNLLVVIKSDVLEVTECKSVAHAEKAKKAAVGAGGERAGLMAMIFHNAEDPRFTHCASSFFVELYNMAVGQTGGQKVKKFENKSAAVRRTWAALESIAREATMPETETKERKSPERKVEAGKPPKSAAEFKPITKSSIRGQIADMILAGDATFDKIATELNLNPNNVRSHVFCMHRDSGFGYKVHLDGKLELLYPEGKAAADTFAAELTQEQKDAAKAEKQAAKEAKKAEAKAERERKAAEKKAEKERKAAEKKAAKEQAATEQVAADTNAGQEAAAQ